MKLNKMSVLGLAAAGVLLASLAVPSFATALRTLVLTTLTATSATITTLSAPTTSATTSLKGPNPTAETLANGFTVTADACGGLKRVTSTAGATSDTTNTFTAPATAGSCRMWVVNSGTTDVILDNNANFPLPGSVAGLTLAGGGSIQVYSDGTYWRHGYWTEY